MLRHVGRRLGAALGTAVVAGALAAGAAASGADGQARPAPSFAGLGTGTRLLAGGTDEAQVAGRRRAADRRSGAARERRRASRTAYRDRDRTAARALAERLHPRIFVRDTEPEQLARGRVGRAVARNVVQVEDADGTPAGLMTSSEPLRGQDGPLDLTLKRRDGAVAPTDAAVATRISTRAESGTTLGVGDDALRVAPEAALAAAAPEIEGDTAFFNEIAVDTDLVWKAAPSGAETFHVLRSPAAPERLTLRVELPDGALLRESAGGGFEVVRDGATLYRITAPVAWDADDTPVEVTAATDGRAITMDVDHREADLAYPIVVDPYIRRTWSSANGYAAGVDTHRWTPWPGFDLAHHPNGNWLGAGWYTMMLNGSHYYPHPGQWGGWYFQAPAGAMIQHAWIHDVNHDPAVNGGSRSCMYFNITDTQGNAQSPLGGWCETARNYQGYTGANPAEGNRLRIIEYIPWWGSTGPWAHVFGGVTMELHDNTAPSSRPSTQAGGLDQTKWYKDEQKVRLYSSDYGLGLQLVRVRAANWGGHDEGFACNFNHTFCPTARDYDVSIGTMPEGWNTVQAGAIDIAGNGRDDFMTLKVDRSGPADIALGGPFATDADRRYDQPVRLDVSATDGSTASAAQRRSGVRKAELYVDGVLADANAMAGEQTVDLGACTAAAASCAMNTGAAANGPHLTFDPRQLPEGEHTVKVRVTDQLGSFTDSAPVTVQTRDGGDGTTPTLSFTSSPPAEWVDTEALTITASAADAPAGVHHVDLTEPLAAGEQTRSPAWRTNVAGTTTPCEGTPTAPCPGVDGDVSIAIDTSQYREGIAEPSAEVVDATRQRSGRMPWRGPLSLGRLKVDHTPPAIALGGDFAGHGPAGKAFTEAGTYRLQVDVTDGSDASDGERRSGVDSVALELATNVGYGAEPAYTPLEDTDPRVEGTTQNACVALDSCAQRRAFAIDAEALGEGLHAVRIVARDELADEYPDPLERHTTVQEVWFYVDLAAPTLDGQTVQTSHPLTQWFSTQAVAFAAKLDDAGSGVRRTVVEYPPAQDRPGSVERFQPVFGGTAPCGVSSNRATRCPLTVGSDLAAPIAVVNMADVAEGAGVQLSLTARDAVDRATPAQPFVVNVDRTPPGAPTELAGDWDAESGAGVIRWVAAADALSGVATYRVRHRRASEPQFTDWANVADEELVLGAVTGAEQVAVEVQAVDAAGNAGAVAAATVTIAPDAAGPAFDDGLLLEGGATPSGYGRISWLAPEDTAAGTDATPSGVKEYEVTYRRGGQSSTVTAEYPWIEVQDAAAGASYELTVRARDWAGNLGPAATATIQLGTFEPCDDAAPEQGSCPDGTDEEEVEENADGDVIGELEPSSPQQRSPAKRYLLRSDDGYCKQERCFATFRSYAKSWVVGLVPIGHKQKPVRSYVYSVTNKSGYHYGEVSRIRDGVCRWVGFSVTAGDPFASDSSCDPANAAKPNFSKFQYPDFKGNNCFQAGTRKPVMKNGKRQACGHGTAIRLERASFLCPDVGLNLGTGKTRGCRTKRIRSLAAGACVDWRYITRDGNYVMVTDTGNTDNKIQRGGWGFVPRGAFAKHRLRDYVEGQNTGGWPGIYQRGTCANPNAGS